MTIKIAHLADTHLGYRQYGLFEREDDFYESFENVIDDIIEKDVDYVLHCGDLFEHPKPPIPALLVAQKCFNKLMENDIEVYVIAGNHDILQRRHTALPQELFENDKFHIVSTKDNQFILDEDIYLTGLPYIQKVHESTVKEMLDELAIETRHHKHSIVMLHGGVAKLFNFECEFENETIPEGFDYYAMGHIHERKMDTFKNGILCYPGSTDINNKGEIAEYEKNGKGYVLLTVDDDIRAEYVNIEVERKIIAENVKYYDLNKRLDELRVIIEDILSNTTKKPIVILNIQEGSFERSEVSEKVYDKIGDLCLSIKLSYEPTIIDGGVEDPKKLLSHHEALSEEIEGHIGKEHIVWGISLYENLSKQNLEGALESSEKFFEEHYKKEQDDDN
ncbi:MAG: hypothetical protein BZ138_05420 [Methanosphaera sp. rholeuAM270]|nr:MAG: hypothetical protein BZ138_05420 [Methanosphaera sp. rholeuAM270]